MERRLLLLGGMLLGVALPSLRAQLLTGTVRDEAGQPVTYVSVNQVNGRAGDVTDQQGRFSLYIPEGEATIAFSHMAFLRDTITVNVPGPSITHVMISSPFSIDIVEIEGGKKDPAYEIIRQVIEHKRKHKSGPESYTARSYLKSVLIQDDSTLWEPPRERTFMGIRLNDIMPDAEPDSPTMIPDSLVADSLTGDSLYLADTTRTDTLPPDPSIVNFMEMIRTTHYQAPNKVKTIVDGYRDFQPRSTESGGIAVSFADNNASEDYRTELRNPYFFIPKIPGGGFNFYENLINIEQLGDRPFISPLHSTSWQLVYRYRLMSREYVKGKVVFEIEVTPRNPVGPYFSGTIWVINRDWVISEVDLRIQRAGLRIFNRFEFRQRYGKQPGQPWLLQEEFYSYEVKEGKTLKRASTEVSFQDYQLNQEFPRNFFQNELMRTDAEAFEKDSSFWETMRPRELNLNESTFAIKQDSIKKYQASDEYIRYQDSIYNRFGWRDIFFEGISYLDRLHGMRYFVDPLVSQPRPFGVGGYRHALGGSVAKTWNRQTQLRVRGQVDYGFNNRDLKAEGRVGVVYDPRKFGRAWVRGGDIYSTITTFTNIGAILSRSNFVNKQYIGFGHSRELINGLTLSTSVDFASFGAIDQIKLAEWGNELFGELNIPQEFDPFTQLAFQATLRWTPFQKYVMEPFRKVNLPTQWPTFSLTYERAVPQVLGSTINWSKITLVAQQELQVGSMGTLRWRGRAGTFPVEGNLRFTDYTFFRGTDPYFFANPLYAFQLLGPTISTPNEYVEGHFLHDFEGALVQKIPLLKHVPLQLSGGGGTLYIRDQNFLHSELFAGIAVPLRIAKERFKLCAYYVTAYSNHENALTGQVKFGISFYDRYRQRWNY